MGNKEHFQVPELPGAEFERIVSLLLPAVDEGSSYDLKKIKKILISRINCIVGMSR